MTASADFELSSDGGSSYAASNASLADALLLAYNGSGNYSCKARLTSTADVVAVQWEITTADDEHLASLPTVTSNADKTCSFTIPKQGGAWIVRATVTDGSGTIRTNTLAVKVASSAGHELVAAGEGTETGEAGWVRCLNDLGRSLVGGSSRPDTDANDLIFFPLDDAIGTTSIANDGAGTAFTLTTFAGDGTEQFESPTPVGDGMICFGVRYVSTGGATYQPSVTNFTASCWFQLVADPVLGGGAAYVSFFGKANTTDATFSLGYDLNAGEVKCKVGAGGVDSTYTSFALSAGPWYFLALTYDGANVKMYLNGTLLSTTAKTGTLDWDNTKSWIVGNAASTGNNYILADVRFANVVRTHAQIKSSYRTGMGWSA